MNKIIIKISKDFSPTPGPRSKDEGDFSGEEFREQMLFKQVKTAIDMNVPIEIDLDGTAGYGTSFLEESFGGLIRVNDLPYEKIIERLKLISNEEEYLIDDINQYLKDAYENKK